MKKRLTGFTRRLKLGIKPGLVRMEWMLGRLGNPERDMKVIHVGGTNGKGSTVTYLRSILNEAGYRVGAFTSPYISSLMKESALMESQLRMKKSRN